MSVEICANLQLVFHINQLLNDFQVIHFGTGFDINVVAKLTNQSYTKVQNAVN